MHKPWQSLLFGLAVFLTLAIIIFGLPEKGITLSEGITLKVPSLRSIFGTREPKKDITEILKTIDSVENKPRIKQDTSFRIEGPPAKHPRIVTNAKTIKLVTDIQYTNKEALSAFFESLATLETSSSEKIRVLHYGDSQIEGDRMTDYLRAKWQTEFGGAGPGLISPMPLTPSVINKINQSSGWDRYNVFVARDKRVEHKNYGVMGGFVRYLPYKKLYDTSKVITATLNITTNPKAGPTATSYSDIKIFYGGARRKTWCEFYDGPALMAADSLKAWGDFQIKEFKVTKESFNHTIKFKSKDSPDFYGISLENGPGIYVDNIAMRGSSGTFFHQINGAQLKKFYDYLNVKLVILQFGGNALPAIENDTMARNYAGYLRGQLTILKKLVPKASILFIGPSDMCVKEGTDYVTYPQLQCMRDEIKKAVLASGCAFYDMYDSMGGRNSMVAWVEQKLAASDYIHFSPQGARKISALLYAAIMNEYTNFLKKKE